MRAIVIGLALVACRSTAVACSPLGNRIHEIDPAEEAVDTRAPGPASILEATARRYEATGCGECGDEYSVVVSVDASIDDRTPFDKMGYIFVVTSSDPPNAVVAPRHAVRGGLVLQLDPDLDGFEATLRVTPIDLAGNLGPTSASFTVRDSRPSGCAVAKRARIDLALPILFALFFVRRRRYG